MANFKIETNNKININKKPRVYFTCHPDDFETCFKKICEDIFKTHDCAIRYTEDMTESIEEENKEVDIGRSNLVVVPVTFKLLTTPNRAMDEDIPYALSNAVRVLPIMMEEGLDPIYSRADRFGTIQYLNANVGNFTEIPYEKKLKKYLDSVLISDELAARIRAAFDAYIFLSYRKKDRKYANDLMRLIHNIPECQDIAIWFDEFLVPGESFKDNIEKAISDCKLFTLLVTPRIFEKVVDESGEERENYVVSTELPLAQEIKKKNGTNIFAVEMEETDKNALSAIDIIEYTNSNDEEFRSRLLDSLIGIAIKENDTPEHNYLIGLAYLEGIDVEVDKERGLKLIEKAGIKGVPEAMEKLFNFYMYGSGDDINYQKATLWAQRLFFHISMKNGGPYHPDSLKTMGKLLESYLAAGRYDEAEKIAQNSYEKYIEVFGEQSEEALDMIFLLAIAFYHKGEYEQAVKIGEQAYNGILKNYEEKRVILNSLFLDNLAICYSAKGDLEKALEINEKIYAIRREYLAEDDEKNLIVLANLAVDCWALGKFDRAKALTERSYELCCKKLGETHPKAIADLENLAMILPSVDKKEWVRAQQIEEEVYALRVKVLGEKHPLIYSTLNNLSACYLENGEIEKAIEAGERAYKGKTEFFGEGHPEVRRTAVEMLMRAYFRSGEYKKAKKITYEQIEICVEKYGCKHIETTKAIKVYLNLKKEIRKKKWKSFLEKFHR